MINYLTEQLLKKVNNNINIKQITDAEANKHVPCAPKFQR